MSDFDRLGSERQIGMGAGPVPVSAMHSYLRDTNTPTDLWPECVSYWLALDREYMTHQSEEAKKRTPKQPGGKQGASLSGFVAPEDFPEG